jgi:hypothetical protein
MSCSVRYFQKLVDHNPGDPVHLSNLAIALSLSQKIEQSLPYFKAYFAGGGSGIDVMQIYANALVKVGMSEEARPWFYRILAMSSENHSALQSLSNELTKMHRDLEKKSLLAGYATLNPAVQKESWWKIAMSDAALPTRDIASQKLAQEGLQLPAIDGRRFFVPFGSDSNYEFIEVNEVELTSTLDKNLIEKLKLSTVDSGVKKVRVKEAAIGPYKLKDFEVTICDSCKSKLNMKLFTQLNSYVDERASVPFLVIGQEDL